VEGAPFGGAGVEAAILHVQIPGGHGLGSEPVEEGNLIEESMNDRLIIDDIDWSKCDQKNVEKCRNSPVTYFASIADTQILAVRALHRLLLLGRLGDDLEETSA
jgi:hypothetical protein